MKLASNLSPSSTAPVSTLRTLSEIAELHKKGVITDSEFQTIARAMMPEHVEAEVDERITPAIERLHRMILELFTRSLFITK